MYQDGDGLTTQPGTDQTAPLQDAAITPVPAAAGFKIFAGALVTGDCVPGRVATDLTYLGRAEESVDNVNGAAAAATALVRRGKSFKWGNDGSITQAHLMKSVYIMDEQTVAATGGTGTRSAGPDRSR